MPNYVIVNGRLCSCDELAHHGIKGMKWGRRRFQNTDGSLTPAGKKRYVTTAQAVRNANNAAKEARKASLAESRATDSGIGSFRRASNKAAAAGNEAYRNSIAKDKAYNKQLREEKKAAKEDTRPERKGLSDKQKKALKVGAAVAGTALAAYGAYKLNDYVKTKNCQIAAERGREFAKKEFFTSQAQARLEFVNNKNILSNRVAVDVNAGARSSARRASEDSFRKAAENVMSYKKSGGNLSALRDLKYYELDDWFEYNVSRK